MVIVKGKNDRNLTWEIIDDNDKKSTHFQILKISRVPGSEMKDSFDSDRLKITCDVHNEGNMVGNYYLIIGRDITEEVVSQILGKAEEYSNGNYYFTYNVGVGKLTIAGFGSIDS